MGRKKPPSLTADPPPGGEKGRTSDVVERSFEIEEEFDLAALGFGVEPKPSFITKEPKAERKDARINKTKRSAAAQLSTAADLSKNDSDALEAYSEVPKADLPVHDMGRSNPWVTNIAQAGDDHEKARPEDGDRVKEKDFGKDGAMASPEKGAHTGKELSGLSVAKQASGGVAEVVDSDNAALSFDPAEKAGLSHKGEMSIPVDIIIDTNVTRDAGLEGGIPMSRNTSAGTGIMTGTETISTQQSNTDLKPSLAKARTYRARLVLDKRPGRKVHRLAIRVTRRPDPSAVPPAPRLSRKATPPPSVPPPPSELTKDIADTFSRATLDEITAFGKSYNTNGHLLPIVLRDFFPSIVDRQNAVALANEVRTHLHLPLLSARTDRVALQKALAKMRERVYVELYAGLCLPLAPAPTTKSGKEEEGEGDGVEKPSLSLTPSSLHHLSINLPLAFPQEKAAIKAVFQKGGEYGEKGDVVWQAGVGRMAKGNPRSDIGYRGELAEGEGGVHVFVDYSNILHGLLHALYSDPRPLPPRHARILSLPCLSLLLTRGRPISPGSLHLVASSPLHQNMDALVRLGWEVSVLKRVEIYEAEVMDYEAGKLVPRPTKGVVDRPGTGVGIAAAAAAGKANGKTNEDGGKQKHTEGKDVSHETIGKGGGKADEEDKASKDRADMLKPGKGKAKKKAKGGEKAEIGPTKEAGDTNASAIDVGREAAAAAPRPAPLPPPPPPPGPAPGMRRYKEQGVDEILTLKLLQTIYAKDLDTTPTILHPPIQINGTASSAGDHQPTPLINGHTPHTTPTKRPKPIGTIVLATGDARGGQFNATGFLGAVRHAIKRGWAVELWSFSSGMSRAWRETAKREQWDGRFKMYTMDEWKEWLVDVKEDLAD